MRKPLAMGPNNGDYALARAMSRARQEVMANKEHLAKLKEGVEAWNLWRDQYDQTFPDLSRADLSGGDLHKINLSHRASAQRDRDELGGYGRRIARRSRPARADYHSISARRCRLAQI